LRAKSWWDIIKKRLFITEEILNKYKMKRFIKSFSPIFLILLATWFVIPSVVLADAVPSPGCSGISDTSFPNPLNACDFTGLVQAVANWVLAIMGPISVIMVLYAAFLFMTSGGNEERVKRAKKAFLWAMVGIAVALVSMGLVALIKSFLTMGSATGLLDIRKFI